MSISMKVQAGSLMLFRWTFGGARTVRQALANHCAERGVFECTFSNFEGGSSENCGCQGRDFVREKIIVRECIERVGGHEYSARIGSSVHV